MSGRAIRAWAVALVIAGAAGCGGVSLSADGAAAAAGSTPDGAAGAGGAAGVGAGGSSGDAAGGAAGGVDAAAGDGGAIADTSDAGADTNDVGVDTSDAGAETSDAPPRCDAGSTYDGGTCVPIVVVVASTARCAAGGDVLFFDGDPDNYIFKGMQTVTQGQWSATSTATQVHVHVVPTDANQGLWWDAYFDSSELGAPLALQVYEGAMRWPFQTTGHPGLDVSGDGRGCNMVTGRFQIEELDLASDGLRSFTASFEHHCEGGTSSLRGCVHFQR